jgi:hypothetical protein
MKEKLTVVLLCLALLALSCTQAQTPDSPKREWKAIVNVVDEMGRPVASAQVRMSWYVNRPDLTTTFDKIDGLTDSNGVCRLSHESNRSIDLGFQASKAGFYRTTQDYQLAQLSDGDPAKWSPAVNLLLRSVGTPIPMYARRVETKAQKEDAPVGFDLSAGDWVAPYGKGQTSDLVFSLHRRVVSESDYDAEMKLSFTKEGDGLIVCPSEPDTGSEFKTPRTAPEGGYAPERTWHYGKSMRPPDVSGYLIRVRTVLDETGKVKTALYGKVRGDFRLYVGTRVPKAGLGFDYYLNPTPNDRNLEFDPGRNLFTGLGAEEVIREP